MRRIFNAELLNRLLFTVVALGILMIAGAGWRYVDAANILAHNPAAQIHDAGGEVTIESKSQAQGLMAADIERRRMQVEQSNMLIVGGIGLALIGLGWLGWDILRSRRRKAAADSGAAAA